MCLGVNSQCISSTIGLDLRHSVRAWLLSLLSSPTSPVYVPCSYLTLHFHTIAILPSPTSIMSSSLFSNLLLLMWFS